MRPQGDADGGGGVFSNDRPIAIEVQGEVGIADPALNVGLGVYGENDELLFWTFTTDRSEQEWPALKPGPLSLRVELPARLLNEGDYRIELLASLHYRAWILEPRTDVPALRISIEGGLSDSPYWLSKRPGIFAPVLPWTSAG